MAKSLPRKLVIPEDKVDANPTKSFFVAMLTRDIPLMDAIMDLIDNCIDGVHRQKKSEIGNSNAEYDYKGYYADISLSGKQFVLKDNCGGIPLDVAKHYAFKMGRSSDYKLDDNLETLGVYGIGMKRAIFKMGLEAEVVSWNGDDRFKVSVPGNWSSIPEWLFDFASMKRTEVSKLLNEPGTMVRVDALHPYIVSQFSDKEGFLRDLNIAIKNHYGYIIQRGFRISLNGIRIGSIDLKLITTPEIQPYVYSNDVSGVGIEIMIGFYRPFATPDEIEKELDGNYAKSVSENAGITVLCNDRVVLYCDKTFLTGWGESPVPKYHTQFISIAGTVHFRSKNPVSLPVTTTKRGLDTSSAVYSLAKEKIKEGLRAYTTFTNNWKKEPEEGARLFRKTDTINALKPGQSKSKLITLTKVKNDSGSYQIPNLPKPKAGDNRLTTISFKRDPAAIEDIRSFFLKRKQLSAAEIGGWCFDKMHSQID